MREDLLFNADGPPLSFLAATPFTVAKHLMGWTRAHPESDVLRVRGNKSPDDAHFFDELAAALQFPYYFGQNWSAVRDCITDPLRHCSISRVLLPIAATPSVPCHCCAVPAPHRTIRSSRFWRGTG